MSRSQSPNRFSDITVSIIAKPGKVEIHQNPASRSRPSDTMEPQAAVGGGTPAPRKLNTDSRRITIPICSVATTIRVLIVPGKIWTKSILSVEAPETLANAT